LSEEQPRTQTLGRILAGAIVVETLDQLVGEYLVAIQEAAFVEETSEGQPLEAVTIDGKTLRGTIPRGETQGTYLLAVYLPAQGIVLMQLVVGQKAIQREDRRSTSCLMPTTEKPWFPFQSRGVGGRGF
jgi:hypothetical protein